MILHENFNYLKTELMIPELQWFPRKKRYIREKMIEKVNE